MENDPAGLVSSGARISRADPQHVKGTMEKGRPATYGGETKRAHGEEASRLLAMGLEALKVGPRQLQEIQRLYS